MLTDVAPRLTGLICGHSRRFDPLPMPTDTVWCSVCQDYRVVELGFIWSKVSEEYESISLWELLGVSYTRYINARDQLSTNERHIMTSLLAGLDIETGTADDLTAARTRDWSTSEFAKPLLDSKEAGDTRVIRRVAATDSEGNHDQEATDALVKKIRQGIRNTARDLGIGQRFAAKLQQDGSYTITFAGAVKREGGGRKPAAPVAVKTAKPKR